MSKRFDLIGEVRRSIEEETGEKTPRFVAEVWVDNMCAAFCESWQAIGPEGAVANNPDVARHLEWRWRGEDAKKLREVLKAWRERIED